MAIEHGEATDALPSEEIERRMDAAVRRALNTPPQPRAAKGDGDRAKPLKARASKKRATGGKPAPSA